MKPSLAPRIWTLVLTLLCVASHSAEVLRVSRQGDAMSVRFDSNARFRPGDFVCVLQEGIEMACGKVGLATETTAVVPLQFSDGPIAKGDRVELARVNIAATTDAGNFVEKEENADEYQQLYRSVFFPSSTLKDPEGANDFEALSFTTISLSPGLHYQYSASKKWMGGVLAQAMFYLPAYPLSPKDVSGYAVGGHLTATYFSEESFTGTFFTVGIGAFYGKASYGGTSGSSKAVSFLALLGKRSKVNLDFFSMGIGFQYTSLSAGANNTKIDSYMPVVVIDVGWLM